MEQRERLSIDKQTQVYFEVVVVVAGAGAGVSEAFRGRRERVELSEKRARKKR